jgi:hypothetical protein
VQGATLQRCALNTLCEFIEVVSPTPDLRSAYSAEICFVLTRLTAGEV